MPSLSSVAVGLVAVSSLAAAAPCDIYASGGTPCVAAHSTTRSLYSSYFGNLYQVQRDSDNAVRNIAPRSAGGIADSGSQDAFCNGTTCVISIIYDQSGRGNHLTAAPPGGAARGPETNGFDNLASAVGAPVYLNGQKVYGVFISPGTGYRNNAVSGIATGDDAEGMYAIFDGTHYNGGCCFDYGNAETNSQDTGNGHMEAIYFGTGTGYGVGAGNGPWILADLENGLFTDNKVSVNPSNPSITDRFITAIVKGKPGNQWAVRGGNAASGQLSTYYSGTRPSDGYNPMKKEGAIILGIGGDNSNWSQGTFYEGVMTVGYPSDATENSVQADIVGAKYTSGQVSTGPALTLGSSISLRVTTSCCTDRYLAHSDHTVNTQVVSSSSSGDLKKQATWVVRSGLANSACYSFESKDRPGNFIRHFNFELHLDQTDNSKQFNEDATWCGQGGLNGQGISIRSWSYPTHFFRHYKATGYAARNGGVNEFEGKFSFNDDVSWQVVSPFA